MRNLIFILGLLSSTLMYGGTDPCSTITSRSFKQTESKDGKLTQKECICVVVCTDVVEFRVSHTSIQTFIRVSDNVWMDYGSQKVVSRVEQEDGLIVFWKGKSAFCYYKI